MRLLLSALLLAAACAPATTSAPHPAPVRPGVEVFLGAVPEGVRGKRVGLITNHTGTDRAGRSAIDLLHQSPAVELVALFGPEHGLRGTAAPGEKVASGRDERTGLPIHSLYGQTQKPTPEMLEGVEVLLFDIQDIGARPYTYVYTMALGMQAAREKGIPFVVLDRPNPIGGRMVEGNLLDTAFASFVGMYPIPVRHGMTAGELAGLFNREFGIGADLTVVPAEGWRRDEWFDATGLPWINPSPNIRRLEAAIHYPGTVFFEGTNLSEGRGTDLPFEQTGAPWLDAEAVAAEMNALRLPGVRFEAVRFAVEPTAAKFPGETLPGVRLVLTERETYRPVEATLLLIDAIRRRHPERFEWSRTIDRLAGTDRLRKAIEAGTLRALLREWERDAERFRRTREPYLLYR
jgi:uncharacterized protein YbbC (DUF1343 family)